MVVRKCANRETLHLILGNPVLRFFVCLLDWNDVKLKYNRKYEQYDGESYLNVCGVYLIRCKINGKMYVGSSSNVGCRRYDHFGRNLKTYPDYPLYVDIKKFGHENFDYILLVECDKDDLIGYEKLCYEYLKPEYNQVIPRKCNFEDKKVRQKALDACKNEEFRRHQLEVHQSKEYRQKMSEIKSHLKIPVEMLNFDGSRITVFECMRDAERWLNENTSYVGKNKVAKISECCKGTRNSAFGYKWKLLN